MNDRMFLTIVHSPDDEANEGKGWYGKLGTASKANVHESDLVSDREDVLVWARTKCRNFDILSEHV